MNQQRPTIEAVITSAHHRAGADDQAIKTDFAKSGWINKQALDALTAQDPVNALNEAEALVRLLQQRCRRVYKEMNDAHRD